MPTFSYIAIDANTGRELEGSMAGATSAQVMADLKARGLYPTSLEVDRPESGTDSSRPPKRRVLGLEIAPAKKTAGRARSVNRAGRSKKRGITLRLPGSKAVDAKGLTLFTRQLATLTQAGMPILRGLEVLVRQEKNPAFREVVAAIAETIRGGGTLSDGLTQHPALFDRLYLNMVKAGEASGALEVVLERLAEFLEKARKIRGKVKSAMTYPIIIMAVALSVVGGLMVFVVPRFESIFASMLKGQPLPALTEAVLGVSQFIQSNMLVCIGISVTLVVGGRLGLKTRFGERLGDRVALMTPVLGDLILKASVARFSRTLGTLLASGVQILEALKITRDTAGNVHLAGSLDVVHDRVKEGAGIAGPLEETGQFPGLVPGMIEVGEETGKLPDMLERIADTYDEEVDNAVAALTSLLEPVMIVIMAVVVGTVVVALFLPLVRIIQSLS